MPLSARRLLIAKLPELRWLLFAAILENSSITPVDFEANRKLKPLLLGEGLDAGSLVGVAVGPVTLHEHLEF